MSKLLLAIGITFLLGGAADVLAPASAWCIHPRDLQFEPLRWDPPVPERVVLDNGLVIHLLEDDEVPLVNLAIYIRTGSVYEPAEKSGLARLAGSVVRHGGTVHHSAEEVAFALEQMAAELDIYVRADYVAIAVSMLKKNFNEGLELLAEILREPSFDPDRVDLSKRQRIEDIRRRYDRPRTIAAVEFRKLVYGADSPWARVATAETVANIEREDLIKFHSRYFRPNNTIVSISGDLTRDEILGKIRLAFGDWEPLKAPLPVLPEIDKRFIPSVNHVDKRARQSYVRVGHRGYRFHDPNEYALELMNFIFGGGGHLSRLTREVRSRRGLAYSIKSRFTAGQDVGRFEVICETDAANTHETLALILDMITEMTEEPPSAEELTMAKEARINEFVFAYDSKTRIAQQEAWLEYRGYPEDFLDRWVDNMQAITAEDVWNVTRSYMHPEGLTILVVGDGERFDRPLSDFGEVRQIEISAEN